MGHKWQQLQVQLLEYQAENGNFRSWGRRSFEGVESLREYEVQEKTKSLRKGPPRVVPVTRWNDGWEDQSAHLDN